MRYDVDKIVEHISTLGICVLKDYLSKEDCETAIEEMDQSLIVHKDKVQRIEAEGCGGDERLFSFENASSIAKKVYDDKMLIDVCTKYLGTESECFQVLAGKVTSVEGKTINSGGGWHRDAVEKQFKSILYLSDVGEKNAPFQFIPQSANTIVERRNDSRGTRFTDLGVEKIGIPPLTVTAPAGTLVLVSTTNIHRGSNIIEGSRYSFTNYYYGKNHVIGNKWDKWSIPKSPQAKKSIGL
jgi:hypothetical protein